jgi:hypothetical protein
MTDGVKRYGGGSVQAQRLDTPYEFELEGLRYDDPEVHSFTAVRKADTLLAGKFMNLSDDQAGRLLRLCTLLVGKTLDNKDGVPVQWAPDPLPKPKDAGDDWEPKFRGPDGKLHPMHQAEKYTAFAAGSSRRRWAALVEDEEFTAEMETLAEIVKDLISRSTGTPTDG